MEISQELQKLACWNRLTPSEQDDLRLFMDTFMDTFIQKLILESTEISIIEKEGLLLEYFETKKKYK